MGHLRASEKRRYCRSFFLHNSGGNHSIVLYPIAKYSVVTSKGLYETTKQS